MDEKLTDTRLGFASSDINTDADADSDTILDRRFRISNRGVKLSSVFPYDPVGQDGIVRQPSCSNHRQVPVLLVSTFGAFLLTWNWIACCNHSSAEPLRGPDRVLIHVGL
jgi:hypothetical protein